MILEFERLFVGLLPKNGTGRTGDGRFALIIATTKATLPFDAASDCPRSAAAVVAAAAGAEGCVRLKPLEGTDEAAVVMDEEEGACWMR